MREAGMSIYQASPIKRARATQDEMEARAGFLLAYAAEHGPVTVRQLYYVAEVHRMPGISKTDGDYDKIQRQVLKLRRQHMPDEYLKTAKVAEESERQLLHAFARRVA
jgi:hypothetical protein